MTASELYRVTLLLSLFIVDWIPAEVFTSSVSALYIQHPLQLPKIRFQKPCLLKAHVREEEHLCKPRGS